jgi:O-antigen ligase
VEKKCAANAPHVRNCLLALNKFITIIIKLIALWCFLWGILFTAGLVHGIYELFATTMYSEGYARYILIIISLIIAPLGCVSGLGLWRRWYWSRFTAIVLHGFMMVMALIGMTTSYINIAYSGGFGFSTAYMAHKNTRDALFFILFGSVFILLITKITDKYFQKT